MAGALAVAKEAVTAGMTTKDLEQLVVSYLQQKQAEASFKNFRGFPASACVCLNEEIVHGIPGPRKLKKGDLVSVDVGVRYKGLYTDAAFTKIVGKADSRLGELVGTTKGALLAAIDTIKPGSRLGDIGATIEEKAKDHKFGVVRDLVGHGVGHHVHEDPQIPNFGRFGAGMKIEEGMTLALEPMLTLGDWQIRCLDDDWTFVTADGKPAAHFEHTIAVTKSGAEILTE